MKKVLLTIAIIAAGFTANAQDVSFGAKAGLNMANIYGGDDIDNDARTSFHVGAVAEIKVSDKFSVQPELVYSSQGATNDYKQGSITIDTTTKLDYLNLPVMAKYYVAEGLSLEAGPQVGFLLSAKGKVEAGGESETEDIKDDVKSIDFGFNFGAGYKLDGGLNFSVRYNLGLSDIADDNEGDVVKNAALQLSVGYMF